MNRSRSTVAPSPFLELDQDTLRFVLKSLDGVSLQRAFQTCTSWAVMASDDELWRGLVEQEWPLLPRSGTVSWRKRYVTLWRAEHHGPEAADAKADVCTLSALNSDYDFLFHIKHSNGTLLATARCCPVELTEDYAEAGECCGMGEGGSRINDALLLSAKFSEGLHLPRDVFASPHRCSQALGDEPVQEPLWAGVTIHVSRKSDDKVAHLLTGNLDHYTFQDAWRYGGQLNGPGVGSLLINNGYSSVRSSPLWAPSVQHALIRAPVDGTMEMNLQVELMSPGEEGEGEDTSGTEEDQWPDQNDCTPPPFFAMRLKFTKHSCFGDGPFAPTFRTPLTLPDMPHILASLSWA